jgi:hypothetical protein
LLEKCCNYHKNNIREKKSIFREEKSIREEKNIFREKKSIFREEKNICPFRLLNCATIELVNLPKDKKKRHKHKYVNQISTHSTIKDWQYSSRPTFSY